MTIVEHTYPFAIGVDAHARTHTLAFLTVVGEEFGCEQLPTTAAGVARATAWAGRRNGGDLPALWVVEGNGLCSDAADGHRPALHGDDPLATVLRSWMTTTSTIFVPACPADYRNFAITYV